MTGRYLAPVVEVGSQGRLVGFMSFAPALPLRAVFDLAGGTWRVAYIHRRAAEGRLEVIQVKVSRTLSDQDRAIVRAAGADLPPGEILNRIRALGLTEGAFYWRLAWLLETREALEDHPMAVGRLRRLAARRAALRGHGE